MGGVVGYAEVEGAEGEDYSSWLRVVFFQV